MKASELQAIYHELNFWKGFVRTHRFLDGWVGKKKTPELHQTVYDFIQNQHRNFIDGGLTSEHGRALNVLDVGSGVVSILNGSTPNVTAVDPLGDLYGLIFDYNKFRLNPPIAYPCEELPYDGEFDIVHMSNALDHTQKPYTCFWKLMQSVKYGGHLIIQGFENEAKFENWQGFHQWNFTLVDDKIVIENKENVSITLEHPEVEMVKVETHQFENKTWFIWICRRKKF